ncbi:hypothetical protein Scep_007819 [Stephania cephalantha]|uniref:Uncharacterized protein n=1 Tax=Stephania cephalantha TaxID=152367 RepID=A0AAP0PM53_9MAGN
MLLQLRNKWKDEIILKKKKYIHIYMHITHNKKRVLFSSPTHTTHTMHKEEGGGHGGIAD